MRDSAAAQGPCGKRAWEAGDRMHALQPDRFQRKWLSLRRYCGVRQNLTAGPVLPLCKGGN